MPVAMPRAITGARILKARLEPRAGIQSEGVKLPGWDQEAFLIISFLWQGAGGITKRKNPDLRCSARRVAARD